MTCNETSARFECNGTAALAGRRAYLTLIEGGHGDEKGPEAVTPSQVVPRREDAVRRRSAAPREGRAASPDLTPAHLGIVAALLVAALLLVASLSDSLTQQAIASAIEAVPTSTVTVGTGDTLWSIAEECAVEGVSTRDLVSWIEEENDLEGGLIVPGQVLVVPASS